MEAAAVSDSFLSDFLKRAADCLESVEIDCAITRSEIRSLLLDAQLITLSDDETKKVNVACRCLQF
jgi:hypothetical protein